MPSPQQWIRKRLDSDDAGLTLTEIMVGMVMMTIFMGIVTSSIISMFSASTKVQATQNSSGQLDTAFDRLDKQVRYASVIDCPHRGADPASLPAAGTCSPIAVSLGSPASSPYVEFLTAGTMCTQLAIRTSVSGQQALVERTWPQASPANPTTWSQLALGISLSAQNGNPVTPFTVTTPTGGILQQLQLQLVDQDGTGQVHPVVSTSSFTFSALNSTAALPATNPCQPGAAP